MKQNLLALLVVVALAGAGWSIYTIRGLKADVAALSGKTPSQSHAMMDVDYQFSNLWFAAKQENWPLATFYLNETKSHIKWMVQLYPIRTLSNGQKLELMPLYDSVKEGGIAGLRDAIAKQDVTAFEAAYRSMVEQCYSCHEAAEKPFLRPGIPEGPSTRMIKMDPKADWP